MEDVIIVNTNEITGYRVEEHLGLVYGGASPSKNVLRDAMASVRSLLGKEVKESVKMLGDAGEKAITRLVEQTKLKKGNAILCVRFTTASIMNGSAEIMAYGTAVRVAKIG